MMLAQPGAATLPGPRRAAAQALAATGLALAAALLLLPFDGAAPAATGLGLYLAISLVVLDRVAAHHPHARFGQGNLLTLVRAAGVALLAAAAVLPWVLLGPGGGAAGAATAALLGLDGLDGWAARRQRLASRFGARFDMEVDALMVLVLAALVHGLGKAGAWVLGIGLMRYGFVLAGAALPALRGALPPSRSRQAVCVLAIALLGTLLAPPVVPPLSQALAALALAAIASSFAVDLRWLVRQAP
jgi:phosphatidylglycerophosphate synthase